MNLSKSTMDHDKRSGSSGECHRLGMIVDKIVDNKSMHRAEKLVNRNKEGRVVMWETCKSWEKHRACSPLLYICQKIIDEPSRARTRSMSLS